MPERDYKTYDWVIYNNKVSFQKLAQSKPVFI